MERYPVILNIAEEPLKRSLFLGKKAEELGGFRAE